jgi:acid phosphatase family membrane protein YuiD
MFNAGVWALLGGLAAQFFKVIITLVWGRRWQPGLFFSNGGMPSSHSATVTVLTILVGQREGYDSAIFSLVLVFSLFVMMEATGLRQEMGKQAQLLNEIMEGALKHQGVDQRRLRELVGHTWAEVAGGIAFGIFFYYLMRWLGAGRFV